MKDPEYPLLKIKCPAGSIFGSEILLDGKPIPYLRGITFKMHVDNDVNLVQLEILARVEIESQVKVVDSQLLFS